MAVLENEDIQTQVIFLTLLKSGMRKGELMGLRWSDIDLTENISISILHVVITVKINLKQNQHT